MTVIRIHRRIESETLFLPELKPLIGRDVEIIVQEENSGTGIKSGTGKWDAAAQAAGALAGYDFDAWKEQRDYDQKRASDNLP